MQFDADDLDWAMGELLHLFTMASRTWMRPHEVNPKLFQSAWSVLNAQPFPIRAHCLDILKQARNAPPPPTVRSRPRLVTKRYENPVTH